MNTSTTVAILGAGAWGTAVAIHLASTGTRVLLWGHDPAHIASLTTARYNKRYLPNTRFPEALIPVSNLDQCCEEADDIIIAVPSHAFVSLLQRLPRPKQGIAWLTKGIDPLTHDFLSDRITEYWGDNTPRAAIAGPSFASEVAEQLPTAMVIAGNQPHYLHRLQNLLHRQNVRIYLSDDLIGVQCCGAMKNVLAIACGISDGLHYGANAKAALITRGLTEMSRLGTTLGGQASTFMGLAGIGDLVLTCTDNQSRNRRYGLLIGQGLTPTQAEEQMGLLVEGKHNAAQVIALAKDKLVELPICETVHAILSEKQNVNDATRALMTRPPTQDAMV